MTLRAMLFGAVSALALAAPAWAQTMTSLGTMSSDNRDSSYAYDVSANGSVVVGISRADPFFR